ncbi:competence protein TfoX [Candidatus Marinamargulisbacteria bacterium SCGC AG-414-C22]|nr:competence protein TfoX [Candidatus Marinamargulisbacteria bacterium SCGC AG-414-C22]
MTNHFCDYICNDVLASQDGIHARSMFGGFGIYQHGVIFGIIINDQLYFKVDATTQKQYQDYGSAPFCYNSKGKNITMSYWAVPVSILEDTDAIVAWMQQAVAISIATKEKKIKKAL